MATAVSAARDIVQPVTRCRPYLSTSLYVLSDFLAMVLAYAVAILARMACGGDFTFGWYLRLSPVLVVCLIAFVVRGLYPGRGLTPVEEFRRLTLATTFVWATLVIFTFLEHSTEAYSRLVFLSSWLLSIVTVPLGRAIVRKLAGAREWWGAPVIIVGGGVAARTVVRVLRRNPSLGLRIHSAVSNDDGQGTIEGVPVLGGLAYAGELARQSGIKTAIIALPDIGVASLTGVVNRYGKYFSELLIVSDLLGPTNCCFESRSLGHLLTIGVRQNLLRRGPRFCKRTVDLALTTLGGILLMPLVAVIAALIKFASPGPVFYSQTRIGLGQRPFSAWKFRTMVVDSERVLNEHLARDPRARQEWQQNRKLRNDPRITSIGRFLRRFSLDELPQLWNVLRGDMSLIGPRPIVAAEAPRYATYFETYARVVPGITGLWQVSGRNDTAYQQRVELDAYYVHNWSLWLDMYILAQTVVVVLSRKGAY